MTLDVFTVGEAMLRLSSPPGRRLEAATSLAIHVAGAEANVAATLARLGRSAAWGSRLPEGPLGRLVVSHLTSAGVNCTGVVWTTDGRLGIYYVDLQAPPLPTRVIYDRIGSTFSQMTPEDVDWAMFGGARMIHLTGITPALSDSCRQLVLELVGRAHESAIRVAVDVNYRSKLWSVETAGKALAPLLEKADLVICTGHDAGSVFGLDGGPEKAAAEIARRFGVAHVVVTNGDDGAYWLHGTESGHCSAVPVRIVDRIGAGDAFAAGVIDGLLDDDLEAGVRRGVTLAAMALTTIGDQVVTTRDELLELARGLGPTVDR